MEVPKITIGQRILTYIIILVIYTSVGLVTLISYILKPSFKRVKDRPIPPKCLVDSRYGEHKFIKVNGIKLHYVEKGDHSKPLLVFLHGFPEFWYSWRYQLEELSKDYWCVAVDNRGYGDSDRPKSVNSYKIINILNDTKELVTALGREKFTLIGHDWGTPLTWEFLHTYGEMLDGFVLMSGPPSEIYHKLISTEWWQFRHSWYVMFFQGPCLPEIMIRSDDLTIFDKTMLRESTKVTKEDIEAYKYVFSKKGALRAGVNYYRANFFGNLPPRRKTIPKGMLILGEKDNYISQSTVKLVNENYKSIETHVLKDGRHFIQQSRPDEVNELLKNYLKKIYK